MFSFNRFSLFLSLSAVVFSSAFAVAQVGEPASYCSTMTIRPKKVLSYCVLTNTGASVPKNVIYYLHGNGGSAQDILKPEFASIFNFLTKLAGKETPYLVSLSFGPQTVIDNQDTTINNLTNLAIPHIEAELGYVRAAPVRHLLGASLGGFNAMNFVAAKPTLFKSLSVLCPAVIGFNPFSDQEATAYIMRNRPAADSVKVGSLVNQLRQIFGSEAVWVQNDPLQAASAGKLNSVPIYISTGAQDDYGFFEGAQLLVSTLKSQARTQPVDWVPTVGKHCSFDIPGLVSYLGSQL